MSVVYRCPACTYVAEESAIPARCGRCRFEGELVSVTPDEVVAMLEAHEVYECKPCRGKIHSR